MINFFRKIRQQLLVENKTGKYLKYAIGEIVLVMIGILLALQVNNWSEEQKRGHIEKTFLRDINQEFKDNKMQFNRRMERHSQIAKGLDSMISMFPITTKNWDGILSIFHNSKFVFYPTFNPSESSLQSLINSSSFDVIKNERLRKHLLSWKDLVDDYKEEEDAVNNILKKLFYPILINESEHIYVGKPLTRTSPWKLSDKAFNKFENVVMLRKGAYTPIVRMDGNSESDKVERALDSIIIFTNPYLD
jgi:hypothetical protein